MITLSNVSKKYVKSGISKTIFSNFSFEFEKGKNYALMGLNGSGKSTLLRMIAGSELPDIGFVKRTCKVSWPIGFSGGLNGQLTGIQNIKFVSRLYDKDPSEIIKYVTEFAEIGSSINLPIKTYSRGMRARLAFGLSLSIDFDCYLVDEVISVGDKIFRQKSKDAFMEKFQSSSYLIMASHSPGIIRDFCDCGIILKQGSLEYHDSTEELLAAYRKLNEV